MKKSSIYIFFDDVWREYKNYYHEKSEAKIIEDLAKYLADFSKTSKIMIITKQNIPKLTNWLLKNKLYKFVDNISNSTL